MVAVIHTSHSLRRAFNYNEQKVKAGVASCILADNYIREVEELTINQKLNRLLHQAGLNERVKRNSVHISLNFDPSEKLSLDQLKEIAQTYMQKIGFGEQPYLVYQHHDTGHPHLHLVTVKIRADGSRIDTQNIGRNQSEKARQEIEQTFRLVKAKDHAIQQVYTLEPVSVQKVQYGKSETRRVIAQVLNKVLPAYKYTSLPELNAVLQQYNIVADRGSEQSKMFQHQGLLYRLLDGEGKRVGVPLKASAFYQQPTLKYLESRFKLNEIAREPHKVRVKTAVDLAFLRQPNSSLARLMESLKKEGIHPVLQRNEAGCLYGITYVDHRTQCVFKGSDLGKKYSAKAIQERCELLPLAAPKEILEPVEKLTANPKDSILEQGQKPTRPLASPEKFPTSRKAMLAELNKILETFLQPEQTLDYVPQQLIKPRKKKKGRRLGNH
jgi:hypothetical protein